jgi:integrase
MSALLEGTHETYGLESLAESESLRTMNTSQAADLWLGSLKSKGHAATTVDQNYRRLLDKLADEDPRADVSEWTSTKIERFLNEQSLYVRGPKKGQRKSASTIAGQVTCINSFFDWLTKREIIRRNPTKRNDFRIFERPKQTPAETNDRVVTVGREDVVKLLDAADEMDWRERLAINCLVYLGPRRNALAIARLYDYDQVTRHLRFQEKGGKTITKPVPDELAEILDAAIYAGVWNNPDDYLIPSRAQQRRGGDRDDRVIWHIVKGVAERAGVTSHVHALRAAFATHYLENKPGELVALQELMGHSRIETTLVYLRRLDRRQAMETVRDLSWRTAPVAPVVNNMADPDIDPELARAADELGISLRKPQRAHKPLQSSPATEKEGFEPSFPPSPHGQRAGTQYGAKGVSWDDGDDA